MTTSDLANGLENLIFLIRGHKVLIDSDLGQLYGVSTKVLVQAVKRNMKRFPEDFCFLLSDQEFSALRSQFVTAKWTMRRAAPYAFTEHGVAMLSSVLNSDRAIMANIEIMRAFTRLRKLLISHEELSRKLGLLERKYDSQFQTVFQAIREIVDPQIPLKRRRIGFGR